MSKLLSDQVIACHYGLLQRCLNRAANELMDSERSRIMKETGMTHEEVSKAVLKEIQEAADKRLGLL